MSAEYGWVARLDTQNHCLAKWDTGMGENKYMQKYNTDMLSHTSSLVQNIFCLRPEISVGLDFCSRSSFYSFGAFLILICQ